MIKIPRKDFIKEHTHLIKLLESFNNKYADKEAASQKKELKEVVGGGEIAKEYTDKYPADVLAVLEKMTFGDGLMIVGSSSLRSQIYAGDYDGYEVVAADKKSDAAALSGFRKQFQRMIAQIKRTKDLYISDIKSGAIPEWDVLGETHIKDGKVSGYDRERALAKVDELVEKKIITPTEGAEARKLLKARPSVAEYLQAKDELKYHVLRWSVLEIAANKKVLRDGRTVSLEQTFNMPALTKLDCIALVQRSRYTDFSVIYEFRNKDKVLNPVPIDPNTSLAEDVEAYKARGNYFKALKRMFALAKFKDDEKEMDRLTTIFNSDLGRLYQIVSDIKTLIDAIDYGAPTSNIKYEIDQFKSRLANVWETQPYLKAEPEIVRDLQHLLKMRKSGMKPLLEKVGDRIDAILQAEAKKLL